MKISSKSILSPGRVGSSRNTPPISLSTSLSRRLKTSRSIKGGASPAMFPVTGKKRGCGFDNPEPSSPKVTCIGQVRVMSKKKQVKNVRNLSRRRSSGEVSYRNLEHSRSQSQSQHLELVECLQGQRNNNNNNNQRWVHLPLTICEALRAFGSEVRCLFPCRSSCSSTPAIELVDGEDDDVSISRRHMFQDLEIVNDEARVSVCVPPKNALLLMRCRSDPMKMEALTNRVWEPNVEICEEQIEDEIDSETEEKQSILQKDEENKINQEDLRLQKEEEFMCLDGINDQEIVEINSEMEMKQRVQEEKTDEKQSMQEEDDENQSIEEESFYLQSLFEEIVDQNQEFEEEDSDMEDGQEELFEEVQETETGEPKSEKVKHFEELLFKDVHETETGESNSVQVKHFEELLFENVHETETGESKLEKVKALPECLLLMMYEPKLSMEVSKETWVCSSDFIRRHSGRNKPPPVQPVNGQNESKVNVFTSKEHDKHVMRMEHQPARSSCSCPASRPLMAAMLEQKKLVNTSGYEPLVLKRCKSEPLSTTGVRLAPETCFWKNKLEPPRRASFGMEGLGF